ncbi:serine carboxypeptidase-like 18 isoform X3 [Populus alba x Populus x berolinensis]|nr:serine carboxypeptidase-like 18 isoform X3 [Populus alba x Populus x berolinensis]
MSVIRLRNTHCHLINMMLFLAFTLLLLSDAAASKSIIKSLPGFDGNLPFVLETGYIGVGELEAVQLFYYFIESERSPKDDPLVLWLTGGPGCSALSGLIYEIGPLSFDYAKSSGGGKPVLALNPYSWTKIANIIFVDAPVGTGFSYSTTWEGYHVTDTLSAAETYEFLRKWLVDHPKFLTNPLYVAGDSYTGIVAPIIGTIKDWRRCNKTLAYSYNVESPVDYHRNLTKQPYRALIYSGDHDMVIPYVGTLEWIESLNLTIKYDWEPWFVDGQVAGYAMLYADNAQEYITYDLTVATVKGGGHTAPEYRPQQCFAMMDRWFDYYPL